MMTTQNMIQEIVENKVLGEVKKAMQKTGIRAIATAAKEVVKEIQITAVMMTIMRTNQIMILEIVKNKVLGKVKKATQKTGIKATTTAAKEAVAK
jgi:hypothetical protein